jgi:hypothetical protein
MGRKVEIEVEMIRKSLITILLLFYILLTPACNPPQPSPSSQGTTPSPALIYSATQDYGSQTVAPTPPPATETVTTPKKVVVNEPLGFCFSYPGEYTQVPDTGVLEISAPQIPGTSTNEIFWLEISDANNRTTEEIVNQGLANTSGKDVGRWTVSLGGEPAQVLDGMPGQDLQRRVIIVRDASLYILAFMPTRSDNQAINHQLETLFEAITSSWVWMSTGKPCPTS